MFTTGEVQSLTASDPLTVCPMLIGVTANAGQVIEYPVKLSVVALAAMSRNGAWKTKADLLGTTRYAVAGSNPVWLQCPVPSVITAAGTPPAPLSTENVIVTPASPGPPAVTLPDTPKVDAGPASEML